MQQERANVLPPVLEIIEEKSAWHISRKIRQYLIGFMGLSVESKVTEFIREDGKSSLRGEEMHPRILQTLVLVEHIELMKKAVRCDLVLTVLGCHSISKRDIEQRFNPLDEQWKLPIAATFYWYKNLLHSYVKPYASLDIFKSFVPELSHLFGTNRGQYEHSKANFKI